MARLVDGLRERQERWLPRTKCSACRRSVTLSSDDLYPQRQFQLDVVAGVVAEVAVGEASVPAAATAAGASERSVRRFTAWVAGLCDVGEVLALAARLDPDAPVGAGLATLSSERPVRLRAAHVLTALEQLAQALRRRGEAVLVRTGLAFVLGWQWCRHRLVLGLVAGVRRFSPAMAGSPRAGPE